VKKANCLAQRVTSLFCGVFFVSPFISGVAFAENAPDPIVLLQGVLSGRSQIPASSLVIRQIYRDSLVTNEYVGRVDFDGDRRAFVYPGPQENGAEYRTLFDGERGFCYNESIKRVEIRSLAAQTAMLLFDPRVLGISTYNNWSDSLASTTLSICPNCKYELIGREKLEGCLAWHIQVRFENGMTSDYWIDETKGFRVYRKDLYYVQTYSYYENDNYPWLPSRVVSKQYDQSNALQREWITEVLDAKSNVIFPKDRWTLVGIGLKQGTDIVDHNLNRSVGVWSGSVVTPSPDLAPPPTKPTRKWTYVMLFTFSILPIGIFCFLRQRDR
jgi:hypothetical protein